MQQDLHLLSSSHSAFPFQCFRVISFTFPVFISFHAGRSPLLFSFLCYSRPYSNNSSALAPALPPFVPTLPKFWFFPSCCSQKKAGSGKDLFLASLSVTQELEEGESQPQAAAASMWDSSSVAQSRAACGACALQPVSAWERQARECGAEHAGMPR